MNIKKRKTKTSLQTKTNTLPNNKQIKNKSGKKPSTMSRKNILKEKLLKYFSYKILNSEVEDRMETRKVIAMEDPTKQRLREKRLQK